MMPLDDEEAPWGRQEGEPSRAFAAFCVYRDLGPFQRSLERVSQQVHPPRKGPKEAPPKRAWASGKVKDWSREWDWSDRVQRWDERCDQELILANVAEVLAMNGRHVEYAMKLQQATMEALDRLDGATLKPAEALRFLEASLAIERMARRSHLLPYWEDGLREDREIDFEESVQVDRENPAAQLAAREFVQKLSEIERAEGKH